MDFKYKASRSMDSGFVNQFAPGGTKSPAAPQCLIWGFKNSYE
nr:hypothetical protein BHI3_07850 [Bacteriovorax sp. HI3]